jgi:hypothetical protein
MLYKYWQELLGQSWSLCELQVFENKEGTQMGLLYQPLVTDECAALVQ